MRRLISLNLMLLFCLTLVTGCGKNKQKSNSDIKNENTNTHTNVINEQVIDGITFNNVRLENMTNYSMLSINATNNTDNDITFKYIKVYLKDKNGNNVLGEGSYFVATLSDAIKSKETKVLKISVNNNLNNIYSVSYEIVR